MTKQKVRGGRRENRCGGRAGSGHENQMESKKSRLKGKGIAVTSPEREVLTAGRGAYEEATTAAIETFLGGAVSAGKPSRRSRN